MDIKIYITYILLGFDDLDIKSFIHIIYDDKYHLGG